MFRLVYVCPLTRVRTEGDDIHGTGHLKILFMDITFDFETYWKKIGGDIHFANRKAATEREWARHPDKHRSIILWLVEHGTYPQRNPFFFIQDFKLRPVKTMSFNDYYIKYGTTEDTDGWHKVNPTGQKVFYVKQGC